jgi:ribosomal 50S subunit-recycling heat shock protein
MRARILFNRQETGDREGNSEKLKSDKTVEAQFRKREADVSIVEKGIKETKGKRKRKMYRHSQENLRS